MKLFDFTLPNPTVCNVTHLYYRVITSGTSVPTLLSKDNGDFTLSIPSKCLVKFDTYFNCFSHAQYLAHTSARVLNIELSLKGRALVRLCRAWAEDKIASRFCVADGEPKIWLDKVEADLPAPIIHTEIICETNVDYSEVNTNVLSCDLRNVGQEGVLYVEIQAIDDVELYKGTYSIDCEARQDVNIAIAICTYKREAFVKRNVKVITDYVNGSDTLRGHLSVFVVDNGNTLNADDVKGATLFPNKNLGGSGGFTRGIMEALKGKDTLTHVLLTDDDILFHPSILQKTYSLLQVATSPCDIAVGASMLRLDKQNIQHEMGAHWNGFGIEGRNHYYDLSRLEALLSNEQRTTTVDYSAWWFMCMPLKKVEENGLPLPLFIKCDDVEYGLRCNFDIVLLNGIGVWHEPFENKYSAYLEYYIKRNELIVDCLTTKRGMGLQLRKLIRCVGLQLVFQRYFALDFIFDGYKDFLKGADFLLSVDAEQLNRDLIAKNVRSRTREELEADGYPVGKYYDTDKKQYPLQVVTLNGYLIPTFLYKKEDRKGFRTVQMTKCKPNQFFMVNQVLQYNEITSSGFVTKQKRGMLFVAGFRIVGTAFKLLFGYRRAANSFRKRKDELTSFEYWDKAISKNDE